jgi:phage-related protein
MTWSIRYYDNSVVQAIEQWPPKLQAKYLRIIELIENFGPQLGEPLTKPIEGEQGLFEIRVKAKEGIARSFFCYINRQEIMILHSYIKKTQKIPKKELKIAKQRMKEVTS